MNATLSLTGDPAGSFEFIGLPSINSYYNLNRWARSTATAEWRYEAREKAIEALMWGEAVPVKRALVVVNCWPPFEEISDIHNIYIKALLDGFTEAELYPDDEWAFMPLLMYRWAGIGTQKPRQHKTRRTVLDVYELDALIINEKRQRLPLGRTRFIN